MFPILISLFIVFGSLSLYALFNKKHLYKTIVKTSKTVLFIIAHPDDEVMFFGPTVRQMCKEGVDIHLLCLSSGNYYKEGHIRKKELRESCKILGIPLGNVTVIEHSKMPDSPTCMWRGELVATMILNHIERLSVNLVFTFDRKGVSGHINHIAIYRAVKYLLERNLLDQSCRIFALETVNILRKYTGALDILLSCIFPGYMISVTYKDACIIKKAMSAHSSQLVWFRRLYITFSRYVTINTFQEMTHNV